jgi:hypothetical protein
VFNNQSKFFIEISRLTKGDVFVSLVFYIFVLVKQLVGKIKIIIPYHKKKGLDTEFIEAYPNCQLISDNCECFVIDKDVLLSHAPKEDNGSFYYNVCFLQSNFSVCLIVYLLFIFKERQLFPPVDEIGEKFKIYLNWRFYSRDLLKQTALKKQKSKKMLFR